MVFAELGLNYPIDTIFEAVNVGDVQTSRRDWLVDYDVCGALVEEFRPGRPNLPGPVDGDWNHGQTRRDCHTKGPLFERVEIAVTAAGAFGKHDQGVAVLLGTRHAFIDRTVGLHSRTAIDLDHPPNVQCLGEDGDLVELLFRQISDWRGDRSKQQGDVEVGQMVGEEEVLRIGFDMFGPRDFVAHRGNQQERHAPQLQDCFAESAQSKSHSKNECCRDNHRV